MSIVLRAVIYIYLLTFANIVFSAITFESDSSASGFGTNYTFTAPSTLAVGDVLIVHVIIRDSNSVNAITPPLGWTEIGNQQQDDDVLQSIYYKVATNSDVNTPAETYPWSWGNSRRVIINMQVYRGASIIPIDNFATNVGMNGSSVRANAVNATNPNGMLITFYSLEAGNQSFTPDNTMTEIYDLETGNNNNGLTTMSAYQLLTNAGSTGSRDALTTVSNDDGVSHTVVLAPLVVAPEITSLSTNCSTLSEIIIQFSETLDSVTAQNINNYSLVSAGNNSISIANASLATNTVTLTLANDLSDLTPYTLTVNNVEDLDGNSIASNSSDSFSLSCEINCITDNFVGPGDLSDSWSVGNSSGSFGDPTIVANGRLRLTDASNDVSTFATLLNQFPGADNRIEIEFDYYGYGGSGADGISVNFSDASVTPTAGAFGGSLGYAQKTGINGFAGGWLGVGLDEYGNFSTSGEGREGGGSNSRVLDSISLRGSGNGTSGYPFLTGTSSLTPGIDQSGNNPNPGHRYKIIIDHTSGGGVATVSVQRDTTGTGSSYQTVIPQFNIYDLNTNQAVVPENWVVSFTGSTGGSANIHEIGDLKVCAAQPIQTFVIVDHYDISVTSPGLTCEGSEVTLTAHNIDHDPVNVLSDTNISITTTPAVTGIISSPVTILAGTSSTSFYLQQTSALANIDIDVTDGTFSDEDGTSEDPRISFLDAAFRFYADASNTDNNPITTQISGKSSSVAPNNQSLELRAVRTNTDTGACEVALSGPQTVSLAYSCVDPDSCSTAQLLVSADETKNITGTDDNSGLAYTNLNMIFDANGSAPFHFTFPDAGKIQLHANLNVPEPSPNPDFDPAFTLTGSSNEFVVRPFTFDLGLTGDYEASNSGGTRFVSAGSDFSMRVRAVNWQAIDDTNNDGFPDAGSDVTNNTSTPNFGQEKNSSLQSLVVTHTLILPNPGNSGNLTSTSINTSVGAGFFTDGITDGNPAVNLSWSEVGIIDLEVTLDNYLLASTANIAGVKTNVGRFYPASFSLISSTVSNSCGSFSYMDQPGMSVSYELEARNTAGIKTLNYDGDFAKATLSLVAENNNEGTNYQSRLNGFNTTSWSNGDYVYVDDGRFDRLASGTPDGPYQDLKIGIQLSDNDGGISALTGLNMRANTSSNCTAIDDCDALELTGGLDIRFGQLKLSNVFGPETSPLDMTVRTEYFNGPNFVLNTDDNCTTLLDTDPPLIADVSSYTDNLADGDTSPLLNLDITLGIGNIVFDEAGLGNEGSVIYRYDTNTYLPWLNTENDNDGNYADNPFGRITFGQFRGTDRMIYWREIVR